MLAEMQSAMNNMVNNQLQSDFQLASLSSSSPGATVTPQPPPLLPAPPCPSPPPPASAVPPLPHPPCQSPLPSTSPPPSPGMDSTIRAITHAHRETFLYAHDKLTPHHQQQNNHTHHRQNGEAEQWGPNRCPNGYQANGLNTIYNHNNNLGTGRHLPADDNNLQHHHGNRKRSLQNSNIGNGQSDHVTQKLNCPMKNRTGVVLVRTR